MAAARSKRNTNEINYTLFNNTGKKMEHEMEEGQLAKVLSMCMLMMVNFTQPLKGWKVKMIMIMMSQFWMIR